MTRNCRNVVLLAAVMPMLAAMPAMGQTPANQDGRAHDANNRVGSGGFNDTFQNGGSTVSPNQIIYGNVTGGKEFRGLVGERDPRAFTGPTAGGLADAFIRNSSGAPLPYQPSVAFGTAVPFYGVSRGVAPPSGTVREGFTGTYLGTSLTPQTPLEMSSDLTTGFLSLAAQPLGQSVVLGTRPGSAELRPGELVLQGPLQTTTPQTLLTGSPLYGVRQWQPGEQLIDEQEQAPYGTAAYGADRFRADNSAIKRMQYELQGANGPNQKLQDKKNKPGGDEDNPDQPDPNSLGQPLERPINASIDASRNTSIEGGPLPANANTAQQAVEMRLTNLTPQQRAQYGQYGELRRRLARYQSPEVAALEANREFKQQRAQQLATRKPATRPAQAENGGAGLAYKPLKVTSLATGVEAKGLHDLLASAEDLMRQDKFQSAIDKYDTAERVDPTNGLIPLGRANAELGAGFYRRAYSDLHRVFIADQALLMGQYDLNSFMRPQRLQFITKELQDLAAKDPKQEMPVFLLAYIAYNTGDTAGAARYLAEAQTRAPNDPVIDLLRQRWNLGAANPAPAPEQPQPELSK